MIYLIYNCLTIKGKVNIHDVIFPKKNNFIIYGSYKYPLVSKIVYKTLL